MKFKEKEIEEAVDMVMARLQKDRVKNAIVRDIIKTAKAGRFKGFDRMEDNDIWIEGDDFDYCVSYEVTNAPVYRNYGGSMWEEPYSDEISSLEFEFTQINVYRKDGERILGDAIDMLTPEQYETVKDYTDFDISDIWIDADDPSYYYDD